MLSGNRVGRRIQAVTSTRSSFPKSKHLLRHADFQRVYQSGRRQFTGNMTVFFLRRTPSPDARGGPGTLRVGFTVGQVLGGAVQRNRIKRRLRDAVRRLWPGVEVPVDVVFQPRKSVLELPPAQLAGEVARGLQLAIERAREAPGPKPAQ